MPFPSVIDNTIRKAFVSCPMRAFYRHCENLTPEGDGAIDLHFGACFAKGMEMARTAFFFEGASQSDAVNLGVMAANLMWGDYVAPHGHVKQQHRMEGAMHAYFEHWPMGDDGLTVEPNGVECQFSFPLPLRHPDTDEALVYAGRYDLRAVDTQGVRYVVDEKTTKRLGDSWYSQWDMDTQMTGYIDSVKRLDPTREVQAMVRGISILAKGDYGFAEVNIVRSDWQLKQWYDQMLRDVARMIAAYKSGEWDLALHPSACNEYMRPCDYQKLCSSPHPERLIEGNYRRVVWNPLERK